MRWSWLLVSACLVFYISIAATQGNSNPCNAAATCSECLQAGGDCYWCTYTNFTSGQSRCDTKQNLLTQACPNAEIVITDNSVASQTDVPFGSTIQVRPQKINLKLRPGQKQTIPVKVQPAKDFPVKLYYLMDLSLSMKDDLQNLRSLGTKIAQSLKTITKNYELGFGTFVDKNIPPFIDVTLDRPCTGCDRTFGFRHVFDFNSNATNFEAAVKLQKISGNLDTPEGGFDALMQVAVCSKDLGWGDIKSARRLVVFVTDASPHIEGDGRIGGITMPNDGQCHLKREQGFLEYTESINQDYPSIGFLKTMMKKNKIVPILAVTADQLEVYQKIVKEWSDLGAKVGPLSIDSRNIVDLIRTNYAAIVSTARLIDNSPTDVDVSYSVKSGCPTKVSERECTGLTFEKTVEFDADITLLECPTDWKLGDKKNFQISVPGFGDIEVEIELMCDCDCERQDIIKNSPKCSNLGDYKCGICHCPSDRFGSSCQCTSQDQTDKKLCKRNDTGILETQLCSGLGECICGECQCKTFPTEPWKKINGRYCECDNFGCQRHQGEICGGSNGVCECGKCKCIDEFHGDSCGQPNCTLGAAKCLKDGKVCSGNGVCDCDRCKCDTGFAGDHCERCVSCPNKCPYYLPCVLCQGFNEPSTEECANKKCNLLIEVVNQTETECAQEVGNCIVYYSFKYDIVTQNDTVYVTRNKVCKVTLTDKDDPNILAIVLGLIAGIILLGLLALLIWKFVITAYDNREYEKFEKDRTKANWDKGENPMYVPSKQQFQNPTYSGLS